MKKNESAAPPHTWIEQMNIPPRSAWHCGYRIYWCKCGALKTVTVIPQTGLPNLDWLVEIQEPETKCAASKSATREYSKIERLVKSMKGFFDKCGQKKCFWVNGRLPIAQRKAMISIIRQAKKIDEDSL